MKEKFILLIDDERNIEADIICRNYDSAIKVLSQNILFSKILLDHDLASYDEIGREKTGYDVACFLEEIFFEKDLKDLPELICVSANPSGRKRIEQVFESIRRNSINGV